MRRYIRRIIICILIAALLLAGALALLARKAVPERITYGMSFNAPYATELGLDGSKVLGEIINDLGVRHFRLAAHWTLIEPEKDRYDFLWLDDELAQVRKANGTVIMGVGRRLPRWPECHIPLWASDMAWEEKKDEIRAYIRAVVERYRNDSTITYWQVENEPYLEVFATEYCGKLDEDFLKEEVALVRELDPTRPILVTDSGNLGTWNGAYQRGDAFGTSVYVYFWNPELGQFKTILPPWFYRAKEGLMRLVHGDKKTFLIELSLEPWLVDPVTAVPLEVQYTRMNLKAMDEILAYAKETRFDTQYLWGAEWWYWLKEQGNDEMWERGKQIFNE